MDKRNKYPELKDADWLRSQVVTKPLRQIAEEIGSSYSAIVYCVKKYNIQVPHRTKHRFNPHKSAAVIAGLKQKYPNGRSGEQASNWKGGISKVSHCIRTSKRYRAWQKAIFERDNFSCVLCGSIWDIHADHLKLFVIILRENNILTYNDAIGCKELWDINNGRTLCKICHYTITKTQKDIIYQYKEFPSKLGD